MAFLKNSSILEYSSILLHLTAAFDTVDHGVLSSHMEQWVGIRGTALEWFRSYLADRTFCVSLGDSVSSSAPLSCGVPQGSALGPLLLAPYLGSIGFSTIFMQMTVKSTSLLRKKNVTQPLL